MSTKTQRVIYLDNASTSWPKAPEVAATMSEYLNSAAANPGRGAHAMALASEKMIGDTRALIARFLNAESPERIIFGMNASDALNTAIHGVVNAAHRQSAGKPPHVITTNLEHNSIRRPLNSLSEQGIIELTRIEAGPDGLLNPTDFAAAVRPNTVLVAFTHASNVLGTVQPLEQIVDAVRTRSKGAALTLADASQTVGVVPLDVQALGIDLLAAPGHKGLLGPTGTGILYVSPRAYDPSRHDGSARIVNYKSGGTGIDSATPTQPTDLPVYLEVGTPNTVGIAGLAAGVKYIIEHGVENIWTHERELVHLLAAALMRDGRITLHGWSSSDTKARRVGLLSITVPGVDPGEASAWLDATYGMAVRPGLHCAPGAHQAVGTFPQGTIRISPGPFTTADEITLAATALSEMADCVTG